jgi:hypothetical protein
MSIEKSIDLVGTVMFVTHVIVFGGEAGNANHGIGNR